MSATPESLQAARDLIWQHTLGELHQQALETTARQEAELLAYIRKHQGECFGGWGWVSVPVSRVSGNVHPDLVKSMIARGVLIEGRSGCILGIVGEVEDNGAQTGTVIELARKRKRVRKGKQS